MANELYDLVFSGELVRGMDPAAAQKNLGALFRISEEQAAQLFDGNATVLKKNLDFTTANKYRVAIKKAGCRVDLVEKKQVQPSAASGKASFSSSESQENSGSAIAGSPESPSKIEQSPSTVQQHESSVPEQPGSSQLSGLKLAPVGGDLLYENEKSLVPDLEVDVSAYTLKASDGDLLSEEEKVSFIPLDVDLSALSVAEAGASVLNESEREHSVAREVNTEHFSLAEPGALLGQEKSVESPQAPDVSHLTLQEDS